jgi:hypothetical protein
MIHRSLNNLTKRAGVASKLPFKGQMTLKNSVFSKSIRQFSSMQTDMENFDFSDKLNVEELKLKNP